MHHFGSFVAKYTSTICHEHWCIKILISNNIDWVKS